MNKETSQKIVIEFQQLSICFCLTNLNTLTWINDVYPYEVDVNCVLTKWNVKYIRTYT